MPAENIQAEARTTTSRTLDEAHGGAWDAAHALFTAVALPMAVTDHQGRLRDVSPAFAQLAGSAVGQLTGIDLLSLVHPDDQPAFLSSLAGVSSRGASSARVPVRLVRPDGSLQAAELTVSPLRDAAGRELGCLILADVEVATEIDPLAALHEVSTELSKAPTFDDLCRRAVELGRSRLGFDRLGLWFSTDRQYELRGSFGTDEQGNLRDERDQVIHAKPTSPVREVLDHKKTLVSREQSRIHWRERDVGHATHVMVALWDGDRVLGVLTTDNLIRKEPIPPRQRELLGLYATSLGHLCTLKRAEEALRDTEERYRLLTDTLPQLVWTCDSAGQCDYVSRQWVVYAGLPSQEAAHGSRWMDALHPQDYERTEQVWRAAVEGRGDYDLEYRLRRADGEYRWFKTRGVPQRDGSGKIVRWSGTCTDIHDQKRGLDELTAADRRKDEFLAMLSHELRNPLGPMLNAVEIMRARPDRETGERARDTIERQVKHMARLVDDLLDVSRITRGKIELRRDRVDLRRVVLQVVDGGETLVREAGHDFSLNLAGEPLWVQGDATRLEQVLTNLLTNAAKYTRPGGRVSMSLEATGKDTAVVRVRDNGMGIAPELLPQIFDLFRQGERTLDRSQGGLGIGLTLVRSLVEMHGGSVEARSEGIGQGSEFIVRLPLAEPALPAPAVPGDVVPDESSGSFPARRVLVVEDNLDAAETLAELLDLWSYEVRLAHDGPQGLAEALSWAPDVVLLDVGLPQMDGWQVAQQIRAAEESGSRDRPEKRQTLVAVTGYGQAEDRQRSIDAGFNEHLTKPIDPERLRRLLIDLLAARA